MLKSNQTQHRHDYSCHHLMIFQTAEIIQIIWPSLLSFPSTLSFHIQTEPLVCKTSYTTEDRFDQKNFNASFSPRSNSHLTVSSKDSSQQIIFCLLYREHQWHPMFVDYFMTCPYKLQDKCNLDLDLSWYFKITSRRNLISLLKIIVRPLHPVFIAHHIFSVRTCWIPATQLSLYMPLLCFQDTPYRAGNIKQNLQFRLLL